MGNYLAARLAAIDQIGDASIAQAQQRADALSGSIGGNLERSDYGAQTRSELQVAKDVAKAREGELWDAVDPDGTLALDTAPIGNAASQISGEIGDMARKPSGEEASIFADATRLGGVRRFRDVADLSSRLSEAMRDERFTNGDTVALRRMAQLQSAVRNSLAGAATAADEQAIPTTIERLTAAPGTATPGVGEAAYTASGRRISVRYEPVEARSLITSHNPDLTVNGAYPAQLQPRERARVASAAQIADMSAHLQPERLGASTSAAEGAPIVGPDNVVESGNGRVLAIRRAYAENGAGAKAYRDFLERQGYEIGDMAEPVLVRRRTTEMSPGERIRFGQEANAPATLSMSASERAAVDASRINNEMLDLYRTGPVDRAPNRDFVRAFLKTVPDKAELGALVTKDGQLSTEGVQRVRNALLHKAYGDSGLVSALAETGDENIRAFGGALSNVAGDMAKLKGEIAAGRVDPRTDLTAPLLEAAGVVRQARAEGISIADKVAQADAFRRLSSPAESVLREAYGPDLRGRLSQAKFTSILRDYVEEAGKQTTEERLFGEGASAENILGAVGARHGRTAEAGGVGVGRGAIRGVGAGDRAPGQDRGRFGGRSPGPGDAARGRGASESLLEAEPLNANFDLAAGQRYRAATTASRERAETFGRKTPVGAVLKRATSTGPYNLPDTQVVGRFFNSYENARAYLKAGASPGTAMQALAHDLRRYAAGPDGRLDPGKVETWLKQHHDALRAFPDVEERFRSVGMAQQAVQDATAARKAAVDAFQKSAARHFIGTDPADGIANALRGGNRVQNMAQLARLTADNPDARAGLQRAVVAYVNRELKGTTQAGSGEDLALKSAEFQKFIRRNHDALGQIFSPEQVESMQAVADDLLQTNRSISGSKVPGGPGTAQDIRAMAKHGAGTQSGLGRLITAEIVGEMAEHAGGAAGELKGTILRALGTGGTLVLNAMRAHGLERINDLVTEALLNPDLARELLTKVPDQHGPLYARRLAHQIGLLTLNQAFDEADQRRQWAR